MKNATAHLDRRGLTLVEVLVVVVILFFVFVLLLFPVKIESASTTRALNMMYRGVQMYKAIFAQVLDVPDQQAESVGYPSRADPYDSSTAYFRELVANGTLRIDFSFFGCPGPNMNRTNDPSKFRTADNAWNVALDIMREPVATPFLFSRNFLADRTNMVGRGEFLSLDMLGDRKAGRKLDFDQDCAVLITKAGTGFVVKKRDFKDGFSAERVNPTDYHGPFLKP